MEKENEVYTYNGMLFSFKKEGSPAISYNTDAPGRYCAKSNKPVTEEKILHD